MNSKSMLIYILLKTSMNKCWNLFGRTNSQQESDMLKSYLKRAQDDITNLLDEKRTLLETVRSLQVWFIIEFQSYWCTS